MSVTEARLAHLQVRRTARYYVLGAEHGAAREVWIALHGYGQLAADFARAVQPVASAERLVVVPEALSRFYLESPVRGAHVTARVGAAWMTREDRDEEIADHVGYLDALHDLVRREHAAADARLTILGFSQGVATAARWLARGATRADHVILWGGQLPEDVDAAQLRDATRTTRITYAIGDRDEVIPADGVERTVARLAASGAPFERLTFAGGHRLDRGTLLSLTRG